MNDEQWRRLGVALDGAAWGAFVGWIVIVVFAAWRWLWR